MAQITPPSPAIPIVDQAGLMADHYRVFVLQVAQLGIIVGTGSPEGVIDGEQTQLYMDDSGAAGSVLYIKQLSDIGGDTSQGWILI